MMKRFVLVLAALLCGGLWIAFYAVESSQSKGSETAAAAVEAAPQNAAEIPADLREKIKQLQSTDSTERAGAACALGLMKERAVAAIPALIAILGDDTPIQRVYCGGGRSWRGKNSELDKSSPGEQAALALTFIGEPSVGPLITVLKADDWRIRVNATFALGLIKDKRTVEAVLGSIRDQDWRVREKAAWGLGLKHDERVAEALASALRDQVWQVRRQAAWALGLQGDERSVEPLVNALRDEQADVRHQAAWALGLKGDDRSVEPLNDALRDQNPSVRSQAAWALGLKGNRNSVEPLIAALRGDAEARVRQQAAWALGLKGDRRAVDALNAALQDSAAPVRKNAAWALRLIRIKNGDIRPGDAGKMNEDPDIDVDVNVDVDVTRH
jgi:HEAT repeat protein